MPDREEIVQLALICCTMNGTAAVVDEIMDFVEPGQYQNLFECLADSIA